MGRDADVGAAAPTAPILMPAPEAPRRWPGDDEGDDPGPRVEGRCAAGRRGAAPRPGADGGSLTARAKINGKNYRKMIKQIAEQGAANVAIVLQGVRPPPSPGGPFVLEGAGFQVNVKTPRPAESGGEPPPG
jgi:hypothetical protein